MKKIYLKCNLAMCKRDDVSATLKRFKILIRSTDGVLSGNMIWNKMFHGLNIEAELEILEAFGIHDLGDKIYGIKSVDLYKDPRNDHLLFQFNIENEGDFDADVELEAEAVGRIYAKLNSLQKQTGVKIAANITTDGISIESSKGHLVYRIMIPKFELDEAVDMTIVIDNTLNDVIEKMMD
nr:MAG TPA: hypothetical protein [Caudoviricetes sp.]